MIGEKRMNGPLMAARKTAREAPIDFGAAAGGKEQRDCWVPVAFGYSPAAVSVVVLSW